MFYSPKQATLKDGTPVILRTPTRDDAAEMLAYFKITAGESEFLSAYPEERNLSLRAEEDFLDTVAESENELSIACFIGTELAGNASLVLKRSLKTRHRASLGMAVYQKYWGRGIGSLLLSEIIASAKALGVEQLELDYLDTNERGEKLYRKFGFTECGRKPDAYRLKDGRSLAEISMILPL